MLEHVGLADGPVSNTLPNWEARQAALLVTLGARLQTVLRFLERVHSRSVTLWCCWHAMTMTMK